jgi:hypothetical protein
VSLHLDAKDLVVFFGDPPAQIDEYFVRKNCTPEEACQVVVQVRNLDDTITGNFHVSIDSCTMTIGPTHQYVPIAVAPLETKPVNLSFRIFESLSSNKTYSCDVILQGATEGKEIFRKTILILGEPSVLPLTEEQSLEGHDHIPDQSAESGSHDVCDECAFLDFYCLGRKILQCWQVMIERLFKLVIFGAIIVLLLACGGPCLMCLSSSISISGSTFKLLTKKTS